MSDPAPPPAPLAVGLKATAAGSAGGGFEELWKAYGLAQKKAEARAAYSKLNPDEELHARLVESATSWRERWAAQGKSDAPRYTLAKWLSREEYECDPPTAYAAKTRTKPAQSTDQGQPAGEATADSSTDFSIPPDESAVGVIERVETWTDDDDGAKSLSIFYRTQDGRQIEQFLIYESSNQKEQERGQEELGQILKAVEMDDLPDAEDLVGRKVDRMINGTTFVSCFKPWAPASREPRPRIRFRDIVNSTPMSGWSSKIGTAYQDEEGEAA